MNIYNTQRIVSSYSNMNGNVVSKAYELVYNKKNNNPGIGRLYLRNNNKEKEIYFKEGDFVNYIRNKKKSNKSLLNRIKNLTKKKKQEKKKKRTVKKQKKKNNKKKKK